MCTFAMFPFKRALPHPLSLSLAHLPDFPISPFLSLLLRLCLSLSSPFFFYVPFSLIKMKNLPVSFALWHLSPSCCIFCLQHTVQMITPPHPSCHFLLDHPFYLFSFSMATYLILKYTFTILHLLIFPISA